MSGSGRKIERGKGREGKGRVYKYSILWRLVDKQISEDVFRAQPLLSYHFMPTKVLFYFVCVYVYVAPNAKRKEKLKSKTV